MTSRNINFYTWQSNLAISAQAKTVLAFPWPSHASLANVLKKTFWELLIFYGIIIYSSIKSIHLELETNNYW